MAGKVGDVVVWERQQYGANAKRLFEDNSELSVRKVMVSKGKSLVDLIQDAVCMAVEEIAGKPCFYDHLPKHADYKDLIIMVQNTSRLKTYAKYTHRDIVEDILPRLFQKKYDVSCLVEDPVLQMPTLRDEHEKLMEAINERDKDANMGGYDLYEVAVLIAVQEKRVIDAMEHYAQNPYQFPSDAQWRKYEAKARKEKAKSQKPKTLRQRIWKRVFKSKRKG